MVAGRHPNTPLGDAELARRSGDGDVAAYEELVRRHRGSAYRVARAILGSPDDAEDAAQEAFLRAFGALGSYDHRREFAAWLRRITVNCAVSRLRTRERTQRREQSVDDPPGLGTPERQLVTGELQARVREAVELLPVRQRVAIMLFALEDLDLAQTAYAMGCSAGTVKAHLHRARHKLAAVLSAYMEEDA